MLVNRWSDGRQATGLRKNEREREDWEKNGNS